MQVTYGENMIEYGFRLVMFMVMLRTSPFTITYGKEETILIGFTTLITDEAYEIP